MFKSIDLVYLLTNHVISFRRVKDREVFTTNGIYTTICLLFCACSEPGIGFSWNNVIVVISLWVPLVEQELLTLPVHLSSLPIFSGVRNTRSLVLCVCFVDRCLSFCPFCGHCVVCPSIYGF
jgi:hypothetical protein